MKKKITDQKMLLTLAGVAVVAGSIVAVADYLKRKKEQKAAHVAELILGIAGVAAGTLIATEPKRMDNRSLLEMDDIFEDEDIALTNQQIHETLYGDEELALHAEQPLTTEDAVEEDIAADFI